MRSDATSRLESLYLEHFESEATEVITLRADGSNREIYRLLSETSPRAIGVYGPDRRENRAFIRFARELAEAGLPVPRVWAVDQESLVYLQEDLGDVTLFRFLQEEREGSDEPVPPRSRDLYRKVVQLLPHFQVEGGERIDYSLSIPRPVFDHRAVLWDLHYFKYLFLKLVDAPFDEDMLEDDLERLAGAVLEEPRETFMYRDFQSRNIMVRETGEAEGPSPWFIDFQGGRRGPLQYDLASLLWDAKADLPQEFREEMIELYLAEATRLTEIDIESFRRTFPLFVLIRALQAMGAYGYRGLYQGKKHFIASIPFAVRNVTDLIENDLPIELPELASVFEWLSTRYQVETDEEGKKGEAAGKALRVKINSFGYPRGGYPVDNGEHGGGYIFDCRLLKNPGRQESYRDLSGLDGEVVDFLEALPEVERFYRNALAMVEGTVDRYLERGFDSLSVGFGCTGGQHRSVYMAERLSRELKSRYGSKVEVELTHREEENWRR